MQTQKILVGLFLMALFCGAGQAQVLSVSSNPFIAPDPASTGFYIRGGTITLVFQSATSLHSPMTVSVYPLLSQYRFSSSILPSAFLDGNPADVVSVAPFGNRYDFTLPVKRAYNAGTSLTIIGCTFDVLGFNPTALLGDTVSALISIKTDTDWQFATLQFQTPVLSKVSTVTFQRIGTEGTAAMNRSVYEDLIRGEIAAEVATAQRIYDQEQAKATRKR